MSLAFYISTALEISAVILLIIGFIFEEKVAAFERNVARMISCRFKTHRAVKDQRRAQAENPVQARAGAAASVSMPRSAGTVKSRKKSSGRVA